MKYLAILSCVLAAVVLSVRTVWAQSFPNRVIRVVVGGVGGGNDFVARLVAQGISIPLKQQVIVENRPSGVIPGDIVSKASPDGHTLLVTGTTFWLSPFLESNVPYDPVNDFSPVTLMVTAPNVLVVHPLLPVKSVKELIALAKARPGELNYSSGQAGASAHLAAELFKAMAGVNIVRIPYRSAATQMADLIGGHIQLTFGNATIVTPHIKSGRLRPLAVTSLQQSAFFIGLPTVAESGLPGFESAQMSGMFAPARTPDSIIHMLSQEVVRFLRTEQAKEKVLSAGVEVVGSSSVEFAAKIKAEMSRMGKLIKDKGIRAD